MSALKLIKNEFKGGVSPKLTNEFKATPAKEISQVTGRIDVKPFQKLNPPKFETELIEFKNKGIFWRCLEKATGTIFSI
jgi:hypothetical protein